MPKQPANLNLQTIAALRQLLATIDTLESQPDDTPIDHDAYHAALRDIESLRAIVTRKLAPLEQRLFTPPTPMPRTPDR